MRIPESVTLTALSKGGCIRTFWRASASTAGQQIPRIPDGYMLISADERDEIILNHTDFLSVADRLTEAEKWEQAVGGVLFGGSVWKLRDTPTACRTENS